MCPWRGWHLLCPQPCSAPAPSLLLFLTPEGLQEGGTVVCAWMGSGSLHPSFVTSLLRC